MNLKQIYQNRFSLLKIFFGVFGIFIFLFLILIGYRNSEIAINNINLFRKIGLNNVQEEGVVISDSLGSFVSKSGELVLVWNKVEERILIRGFEGEVRSGLFGKFFGMDLVMAAELGEVKKCSGGDEVCYEFMSSAVGTQMVVIKNLPENKKYSFVVKRVFPDGEEFDIGMVIKELSSGGASCVTTGACDGICNYPCTLAEDPDCSMSGCCGNGVCEVGENKDVCSSDCKVCVENWSCGPWGPCVSGYNSRACVDGNNCGTFLKRPDIAKVCTEACAEKWKCTPWSICENSKKQRKCVEVNQCDSNNLERVDEENCTVLCFDKDGDGYDDCSVGSQDDDGKTRDCDDENGNVNIGVSEVCDGVDNNCNNIIDEGCACVGGDKKNCGSNIGRCEFGEQVCVAGVWSSCSGGIQAINEICNNVDDDCDGEVDENLSAPENDNQEGVCNGSKKICVSGIWKNDYTNILDNEYPIETKCDGKDNNCDGEVDEGCAKAGYGEVCLSDNGCEVGYECKYSGRYPEGEEYSERYCCLVSECGATIPGPGNIDCGFNPGCHCVGEGGTDQRDTKNGSLTMQCQLGNWIEKTVCYDNDNDGYDDCGSGHIMDDGKEADCNDGDPSVKPGMIEICDGKDNDCNGQVDGFCNMDGDAYCACGVSYEYGADLSKICSGTNTTDKNSIENTCDCRDGNPAINPSGSEECDGEDNNCNGTIDEGCVCTGNEIGECGSDIGECKKGTRQCNNNAWGECVGEVIAKDEVCGNGKDENCNGIIDEGCACMENWVCDEWSVCVEGKQTTNCSDDNSCGTENNKPSEIRSCSAGCTDKDGDGYGSPASSECMYSELDCDDNEFWAHPGEDETCDTIDNDCDGTVDEGCDEDGDGFCDSAKNIYRGNSMCVNTSFVEGRFGDDCDDSNEKVNPEWVEVCGDSIDNNCSGVNNEGCFGSANVIYSPNQTKDGNLGGRAGADAFCNSNIPDALSCAKVHAYLSVNGNDEVRDMPSNYGYNVSLPMYFFNSSDGKLTRFANNWAGALDNSIEVSVYDGMGIGEYYWTGSYVDGSDEEVRDPGFGTCSGWTTNSGKYGTMGEPRKINGWWLWKSGKYNCMWDIHVLCSCESGVNAVCKEGEVQKMGSDVGECKAGERVCFEGRWSGFEGQILPTNEVCDGLDNNCDGVVDENCSEERIVVYKTEQRHDGNFGGRGGIDSFCVNNKPSGLVCSNIHGLMSVSDSDEVRDMPSRYGFDNNTALFWYNTVTDNFVKFADNWADAMDATVLVSSRNGTGINDYYWTGAYADGSNEESRDPGFGNCAGWTRNSGAYGTIADPDRVNSGWIWTSGKYNCVHDQPIMCVCDGLPSGACTNGDTDTTGTDVGECKFGVRTCENNAWTAFSGEVEPREEVCDGKDNDCDGEIDEKCDRDGDDYCDCDADFVYGSDLSFVCGNTSVVDVDSVKSSCDCDDLKNNINPAMGEVCGDGIDNNCSDGVDEISVCGSDCSDECVENTSGCKSNSISWVCGENDSDPCLDKVEVVCESGKLCSSVGGKCETQAAELRAIFQEPKDGHTITSEGLGSFSYDGTGGFFPYNFELKSNLDGLLYRGDKKYFSLRGLSIGEHIIELKVVDGVGNSSFVTRVLTVIDGSGFFGNFVTPNADQEFAAGESVNFYSWGTGGKTPYVFKYESSIDGVLGNVDGFSIDTLSAGDHMVTLTIEDAEGASVVINKRIRVKSGLVAELWIPSGTYMIGERLSLGVGIQGGVAPYSVEWISDIDGMIGAGEFFEKDDFSVGYHTIDVKVTDANGEVINKELVFNIIEDVCIDNDGDGYGLRNSSKCSKEGFDCDDFDMDINPGAEEVCPNSVDENCNGTTADCIGSFAFVSPTGISEFNWGESISMKVQVGGDYKGIKAEIVGDKYSNYNFTLFDDGAHSDGASNDSMWGDNWLAIVPEGSYTINVVIESENGNIERKEAVAGISIVNYPECKTIVNNGDSADKLDIVFIADQYTQDNISDFELLVKSSQEYLFTLNPFNLHSGKINVHRVSSVIDMDCKMVSNMAQLEDCSLNNVRTIGNICPCDSVIVMSDNSSRSFAGIGANFAVVNSGAVNVEKIVAHEFGHSFSYLADEYVNPFDPDRGVAYVSASVNCDTDSNCSKWTSVNGTGCFKGCAYRDTYYRSIDNGMMNNHNTASRYGELNEQHINSLMNNYK